MSKRNDLLKYYDNQSPSKIQVEDIDDNFYPLDIPKPDIAYVPPAEPHILITDLYEKKDDWYILSELIRDFADESYASYYNGLYYASFMLSTTCLELTLKYELVRQKKIPPHKLKESNYSFGIVQKDLKKRHFKNIKMRNYKKNIETIGNVRNGMFHFNPNKLKTSLKAIEKDLFGSYKESVGIGIALTSDEKGEKDFDEIIFNPMDEFFNPMDEYLDHFEWNKVAYYSYLTLYHITKDLYGEDKKIQYFQEGVDDYIRIETKNKGKPENLVTALEKKKLQFFLEVIEKSKQFEQNRGKKLSNPPNLEKGTSAKKQIEKKRSAKSEKRLFGGFL